MKQGRPIKCRWVGRIPEARRFSPDRGGRDEAAVKIEEVEAMRLVDAEGLSQIEAAELMDVSRQTLQRLLEAGRRAVAGALIEGRSIVIEDGDFCHGERRFACADCGAKWKRSFGEICVKECPECGSKNIARTNCGRLLEKAPRAGRDGPARHCCYLAGEKGDEK